MPLAHGGLVKLVEECGELTQIAGKKIAYPDCDEHPDGQLMSIRLAAEIGDVMGACRIVAEKHHLPWGAIQSRAEMKYQRFSEWANEQDTKQGKRE